MGTLESSEDRGHPRGRQCAGEGLTGGPTRLVAEVFPARSVAPPAALPRGGKTATSHAACRTAENKAFVDEDVEGFAARAARQRLVSDGHPCARSAIVLRFHRRVATTAKEQGPLPIAQDVIDESVVGTEGHEGVRRGHGFVQDAPLRGVDSRWRASTSPVAASRT